LAKGVIVNIVIQTDEPFLITSFNNVIDPFTTLINALVHPKNKHESKHENKYESKHESKNPPLERENWEKANFRSSV
jgi:site-specific DNA-adenine methylase